MELKKFLGLVPHAHKAIKGLFAVINGFQNSFKTLIRLWTIYFADLYPAPALHLLFSFNCLVKFIAMKNSLNFMTCPSQISQNPTW